MKLLGGDKDADDTTSSPMDTLSGDDASDTSPTDEGFSAAADEVFSALQSKDVASFTDALKTCIEMSK